MTTFISNDTRAAPPTARPRVHPPNMLEKLSERTVHCPDVLALSVPLAAVVPTYTPTQTQTQTLPQTQDREELQITQKPTNSNVLEYPAPEQTMDRQHPDIAHFCPRASFTYSEYAHLVQNDAVRCKRNFSALTKLEEMQLLSNLLCDPNDEISRRILDIHYSIDQ